MATAVAVSLPTFFLFVYLFVLAQLIIKYITCPTYCLMAVIMFVPDYLDVIFLESQCNVFF